jgi:hypothetical protein
MSGNNKEDIMKVMDLAELNARLFYYKIHILFIGFVKE